MEPESIETLNVILIFLISFSLTIISKISDNTFISLILMNKKVSSFIIYLSSILSSSILNIISVIIGNFIKYFLNIDIIKNLFLIIVFILYGFLSIITLCQLFSKRDGEKDKLIERIMNNSSDEDSERPNMNIKTSKNDVEIELEDLNSVNIEDEKNTNNNNVNSNIKLFFDTLKTLLFVEFGEKIQIFNISLSVKYINWVYLLFGNFLGDIIFNVISIKFGVKILEKKK